MAKNKDGGGGDGRGGVGGGSGGQQPITWSAWPSQPRQDSGGETQRGRGRERVRDRERERRRERERGREGGRDREAGTAREGGLPTSDPADGGHMAAASQIKRLRLGGSAITAV